MLEVAEWNVISVDCLGSSCRSLLHKTQWQPCTLHMEWGTGMDLLPQPFVSIILGLVIRIFKQKLTMQRLSSCAAVMSGSKLRRQQTDFDTLVFPSQMLAQAVLLTGRTGTVSHMRLHLSWGTRDTLASSFLNSWSTPPALRPWGRWKPSHLVSWRSARQIVADFHTYK